MKSISTLSLMLALSMSGAAFAQSGAVKNMDGMDMKNMPMANMNSVSSAKTAVHQATGVVRAVDTAKGTVTLAHGPVKSLNWPAMTMTFVVKDKMLFGKLAADKKVTIDFSKLGADYVVTAVN